MLGPGHPEPVPAEPVGAGLSADVAHDRYPDIIMRLPDEESPKMSEPENGESDERGGIGFGSMDPDALHDIIVDAGYGDELKKDTVDAGSPERGLSAFLERHPRAKKVVEALFLVTTIASAAPASRADAADLSAQIGRRVTRQVENGILGGTSRSAKKMTDYVLREATGPLDRMAREQRVREQGNRRAETSLRNIDRNIESAVSSFHTKLESLRDAFGRDWAVEKNKASLAGDDRRSAAMRESEARRLGALCQSYIGKIDAEEARFAVRMKTIDSGLWRILNEGSSGTRRDAESVIVAKSRAQSSELSFAGDMKAGLELQMRSLLGIDAGNFRNPLDGAGRVPSVAPRTAESRNKSVPAFVREPAPVITPSDDTRSRDVHIDDLGSLLERL